MRIGNFRRHLQHFFLEPAFLEPQQTDVEEHAPTSGPIPAAEILQEMGVIVATMLSIAVLAHLAFPS